MDWIQQWQSKLNKQNGVAPLVRTGGSRHTGLAALPYRNIQTICGKIAEQILKVAINSVDSTCIYWHHQPQIPDAVRNLHKEVNTISENK